MVLIHGIHYYPENNIEVNPAYDFLVSYHKQNLNFNSKKNLVESTLPTTGHSENERDLKQNEFEVHFKNITTKKKNQSIKEFEQVLYAFATDPKVPSNLRKSALLKLAFLYDNIDLSLNENKNNKKSFETKGSLGELRNKHFLNSSAAVKFYSQAAALGDETAQFRMATLHAVGDLGVKKDSAKAILYYYFSSLNGHTGSLLALGYRYIYGLDVPKNCDLSFSYYKLATDRIKEILIQEDLMFYNEFHSLQTSYMRSKENSIFNNQDMLDYYMHIAEKNHNDGFLILAQIHYYGLWGVKRNLKLAFFYFSKAALENSPQAQSFLGKMFLKGLGTPKNFRLAYSNFRASSKHGYSGGYNGLGYLYLYGLGVEQNFDLALKYFRKAAGRGHPEANFNLGSMYLTGFGLKFRDYNKSRGYFFTAAKKGHLLSMYSLGLIYYYGIGVEKKCEIGTYYLKVVAEQGYAQKHLFRANNEWKTKRHLQSSLQYYFLIAELGVFIAQTNVAWLLDHLTNDVYNYYSNPSTFFTRFLIDSSNSIHISQPKQNGSNKSKFFFKFFIIKPLQYISSIFEFAFSSQGYSSIKSLRSLHFYQLAGQQGHVESLLKIGDYFFYDQSNKEFNLRLALQYYNRANKLNSSQAKYNLGYMYQYGYGVKRNFTRSKKLYEDINFVNKNAEIPVAFTLMNLWIYQIYYAILYNDEVDILPDIVRNIVAWFHVSKNQIFNRKIKEITMFSRKRTNMTQSVFNKILLSGVDSDPIVFTIILSLIFMSIFIRYYRRQAEQFTIEHQD